MKPKKALSLLLAVALVISAAAAATAEGTGTAGETLAADDVTQAAATVYTLQEMLTQAMTDAYQRQTAYAAYAEAFPDSRSIAGIDMDTQIVLLEMLLKANGVALPLNDAEATVPQIQIQTQTQTEAYAAIAEAEGNALTMYRSFLSQDELAADARIIFRSVFQLVRSNAADFERKAQAAQRAERFQELMNDGNAQVYVINNGHGRGTRVIYVVTDSQTTNDEGTTGGAIQDTAEPAAEDSVSN